MPIGGTRRANSERVALHAARLALPQLLRARPVRRHTFVREAQRAIAHAAKRLRRRAPNSAGARTYRRGDGEVRVNWPLIGATILIGWVAVIGFFVALGKAAKRGDEMAGRNLQ